MTDSSTISLPDGVTWVSGSDPDIISSSVVSGTNVEGNLLHVARAIAPGDPDKMQGTACATEGSTEAHLSYYGNVVSCTVFDVLIVKVPVRWIPCQNGTLPDRAIPSGIDESGQTIFVARVNVSGVFYPAKFQPRFHGAFAPCGQLEYLRRKYDVLCICKSEEQVPDVIHPGEGEEEIELEDERTKEIPSHDGLVWKFARDGKTFDKAVHARWRTNDGKRFMHVIRSTEEKEIASGVLRVGDVTASIPFGKCGTKHDKYEVLVNEGSVEWKWLHRRDGTVPEGAVQAGVDDSGDPVYVARVFIDGERIPGKMYPKTKRAYGAKNGKVYVRKYFEILAVVGPPTVHHEQEENDDDDDDDDDECGEEEQEEHDERKEQVPTVKGLQWVACKDGYVPDDAVVFDEGIEHDCNRLFIARASEPRELVPGGVAKNEPSEVPYFGRVERNESYDVLVNEGNKVPLVWVSAKGGEFPRRAIQGGLSSRGDKIFIARGFPAGSKQYSAGKFRVGFKCAFLAVNDKEKSSFKYELLCTQRDKTVPPEDENDEKQDLNEHPVVCGFNSTTAAASAVGIGALGIVGAGIIEEIVDELKPEVVEVHEKIEEATSSTVDGIISTPTATTNENIEEAISDPVHGIVSNTVAVSAATAAALATASSAMIPESSNLTTPTTTTTTSAESATHTTILFPREEVNYVTEQTPLIRRNQGWTLFTGDFYNGIDWCWWLLVVLAIIILILFLWFIVTSGLILL